MVGDPIRPEGAQQISYRCASLEDFIRIGGKSPIRDAIKPGGIRLRKSIASLYFVCQIFDAKKPLPLCAFLRDGESEEWMAVG